MRADFTLNIEDFREALRLNGMLQLHFRELGWFILIGVTTGFVGRTDLLLPKGGFTTFPGSLFAFLLWFMPIIAALGIGIFPTISRMRRLRNPRPNSSLLIYSTWVVAVAIVGLHLLAARRYVAGWRTDSGAGAPSESIFSALSYPMGLSAAYLLFGLLSIWWTHRLVVRLWASNTAQHRPKSFQASENGIVVEDAFSRHEERWPAFVGFRESEKVCLLYTGKSTYYIIPKRSMDEAQIAFLKEVQKRKIAASTPLFPVMAIACLPSNFHNTSTEPASSPTEQR